MGLCPRYSPSNLLGGSSGNKKIYICQDCCPIFCLNALTTDTLSKKELHQKSMGISSRYRHVQLAAENGIPTPENRPAGSWG